MGIMEEEEEKYQRRYFICIGIWGYTCMNTLSIEESKQHTANDGGGSNWGQPTYSLS